ncbi:MAG: hypothetical protein SFV52_04285 [Saprospiraceae bacterium]|nr:hypothetical protein [Saprospiraceae bacterium]
MEKGIFSCKMSLTIFLILGAFFQPVLSQQYWQGTFDGMNDNEVDKNTGRDRIVKRGNDVLVISSAYVWDNGEGKDPFGRGSDYGYWGPFWKKHGPEGNFHILIYNETLDEIIGHTRLHGPHRRGESKWEWKDNEGLNYINYGIFDWTKYDKENVFIIIYESDPSETNFMGRKLRVPEWVSGREHDILISFWVNKSKSYCGLSLQNHHIPILTLSTVDLNMQNKRKWTYESQIVVKNNTGEAIEVYAKPYNTSNVAWDGWYGPFIIPNSSQNTYPLLNKNKYNLTGGYFCIYAMSIDGAKVWDENKDNYINCRAECEMPIENPSQVEYTFKGKGKRNIDNKIDIGDIIYQCSVDAKNRFNKFKSSKINDIKFETTLPPIEFDNIRLSPIIEDYSDESIVRWEWNSKSKDDLIESSTAKRFIEWLRIVCGTYGANNWDNTTELSGNVELYGWIGDIQGGSVIQITASINNSSSQKGCDWISFLIRHRHK